jgi:hypothetical protein
MSYQGIVLFLREVCSSLSPAHINLLAAEICKYPSKIPDRPPNAVITPLAWKKQVLEFQESMHKKSGDKPLTKQSIGERIPQRELVEARETREAEANRKARKDHMCEEARQAREAQEIRHAEIGQNHREDYAEFIQVKKESEDAYEQRQSALRNLGQMRNTLSKEELDEIRAKLRDSHNRAHEEECARLRTALAKGLANEKQRDLKISC